MKLFDSGPASRAPDVGLLVVRVIAGVSLAFAHGMLKVPPTDGFVARVAGMGFPAPSLFAWLAGLAEFSGGLLLAAGLFTRIAALFVSVNMTIILVVALAGSPFSEREKPLLFFAIALLCALSGAGRYSLDWLAARVVARVRRQPVSGGRS